MTVPASPRSNHSSDKRNHQYDGWRAREETRLPFTLSILDSFTCSSWSSYAEDSRLRHYFPRFPAISARVCTGWFQFCGPRQRRTAEHINPCSSNRVCVGWTLRPVERP